MVAKEFKVRDTRGKTNGFKGIEGSQTSIKVRPFF